MICISLNDVTDRVHISVNDLITWSVFLWTIWSHDLYFCERFGWVHIIFCERLDHVACLSVNDLTESLFLWAIWSHDLYFSQIWLSPCFCERFDWVIISVNYLITWSVFLLTVWVLITVCKKYAWNDLYFCEGFDYRICVSVNDSNKSTFLSTILSHV